MSVKQRLSASVDADLINAAEASVARGAAPTLSAWVNDALRLKLAHDHRLAALAVFIADHERAHGVITDDELRAARTELRARAVRTGRSSSPSSSPSSSRTVGRASAFRPATGRRKPTP